MQHTNRALRAASLIALMALLPTLWHAPAQGQVYRCKGDSGETIFSQRPCAPDAERITVAPTNSAEGMDAGEIDARQDARRRSALAETSETIARSQSEIRKLRSENYDPARCSAARMKMAAMERADPVGYRVSLDYFEAKSAASLHCGN